MKIQTEELHTINAINLLNAFDKLAPLPCQYEFPISTFHDAVTLATAFSGLGLGALQDVLELVGTNGDDPLLRGLTSVVGEEGEQEGFYRVLLGLKPSEKPFLTFALGPFAFSFVNNFVVPGSCPFDISEIDLPLFTPLTVEGSSNGLDVQPADQTLTFSADLTGVAEAARHIGGNGDGLFVTYFSGQLRPIREPVSNVSWDGSRVTFDAFFPFASNVMQGLSIASLTTSDSFSDASDVLGATLAAPGLIQVNDSF
ncbi:hypothetical protein F5884DRAFT_769057 [Xylogone sp. PMI_703]|nr:hypothetical protein F5884DRAFT_769057 [Xylogone sp. PMI_703]